MHSHVLNNKLRGTAMGFLFVFLGLCFISCQQEDVTKPVVVPNNPINNVPARILITQAQLDSAIIVPSSSDTSFTGNPFGQREPSEQSNIRSIFANIPKNAAIRPSAIYAIRNFINQAGRTGQLLFVDVMVKREAGYSGSNSDFEFMRIPFDRSNDYLRHPNGRLPDTTQTLLRGLDLSVSGTTCATCHRLAGNDLLFHR